MKLCLLLWLHLSESVAEVRACEFALISVSDCSFRRGMQQKLFLTITFLSYLPFLWELESKAEQLQDHLFPVKIQAL